MKDEQINLKISAEEKTLLRKAARNLNFETGRKENVSEAVRHAVKKYAEIDLTKPECFFIDRESIRRLDQIVNYGLIYLQKFIDEFKAVNGQTLTLTELETTLEGLGKLGSKQILESAIREMVLQKSYQALKAKHPDLKIEYSSVPDQDLTALFEAAGELDLIPELRIGTRPVIFWQCYSLNGGKISIIPEALEKLKNNHRFYASTPPELQKLQKVKALCQVLNEIMEDPEVLADKIFTLVYFDQEAARWSPSGAYIKYNLQPQILFTR